MTDKRKEPEATEPVMEPVMEPTKVFIRPVMVKSFSFEQWAKLNQTPDHHIGGMRGFLGLKAGHKYTLAMWDEIFESY